MADLITTDQFETRTGRSLSSAELDQASALISDASALVIDIVNDSDITDSWDTATAPGSVVPVVVAMVRRGMDNPHGFTGETTEGYSYTGASGIGVFATRAEARVIRKAAGTSSVGALNLDSHLPHRAAISWLDGAL